MVCYHQNFGLMAFGPTLCTVIWTICWHKQHPSQENACSGASSCSSAATYHSCYSWILFWLFCSFQPLPRLIHSAAGAYPVDFSWDDRAPPTDFHWDVRQLSTTGAPSGLSVTPYATCTPVSEISTTGLIGRLLLLRVVLSHFLLSALRSPHGFLLLLHLRDLLPPRTLIFWGVNPFWWCQKGREIFWWCYLWCYFGLFFFLCMYLDISLSLLWTSLFGVWYVSYGHVDMCLWTCVMVLRLAWTS